MSHSPPPIIGANVAPKAYETLNTALALSEILAFEWVNASSYYSSYGLSSAAIISGMIGTNIKAEKNPSQNIPIYMR